MGKIEIDHTGSGGGITLSSDGTSLLLGGTAIGGSPDLYAANDVSATAPSATGNNSVAIGDSSTAAGLNSTAIGYSHAGGTRSFAAAIGNSGSTRGAQAIESVAIGNNAYAQGSTSLSLGYYSNVGSSGSSAVALTKSYANGADSFAAAIGAASTSYGATGANSVAIGYQAKATGQESLSFGSSNTVSVDYSGAYGRGNTISGGSGGTQFAFGAENSTSSTLAFAFGYKANAPTSKFAFANSRFSTNGDAQQGMVVLRSDTTDATAEALTVTNGTADATNQIILPNNSAYAFHGTIVARQNASAGTASAAWKIEGLIRREANAGTTTLVNSATTVLDNTPSWGMALSADTTNGGLKIEVTGAASTNIRWVATINTSEVTYA